MKSSCDNFTFHILLEDISFELCGESQAHTMHVCVVKMSRIREKFSMFLTYQYAVKVEICENSKGL